MKKHNTIALRGGTVIHWESGDAQQTRRIRIEKTNSLKDNQDKKRSAICDYTPDSVDV